jgi:hypothetical protein
MLAEQMADDAAREGLLKLSSDLQRPGRRLDADCSVRTPGHGNTIFGRKLNASPWPWRRGFQNNSGLLKDLGMPLS